jgi:hypothetical protein
MTSRHDSGSAKRLQNELFELVDFTVTYESPLEDFDEETMKNSIHPLEP